MGFLGNERRRLDAIFWAFALAGGLIAVFAALGSDSPTADLLGGPALALLATAAVAVGNLR